MMLSQSKKFKLALSFVAGAIISLFYTNCSKGGFQASNLSGSTNLASSEPAEVQVQFGSSPSDPVTGGSADYSYTVIGQNLSGVSTECYLNSTKLSSCESSGTLSSLEDMDYTMEVVAVNQNSYVLSKSQRSFRVDSKAPILTINQAPSGQIGSNSVMISFSVTDNYSGAVAYCSLDNAAAAICNSPLSLTNLAVGAHSVKIYAQDRAGNKSATQTVSFSVVLGLPSVSLSQMPTAFTNSTSASFSFSGTSANSTIAGYECSLDNSAYAACTSPQSYSGLAEASHSFSVRAKDALGQMSSPASYNFQVDLTKPSVPVVNSDSMSPSKSTSLNLTFNSSDASGIASFECKIDGGAFAACASPKAYSGLSSASHSFAVRAKDKAGNISNEGSYSILIDTAAPVVTITMNPEASTQVTSASFGFSVSDALSGVNLIECQLDTQAYATCASPIAYNNLAAGNHTFKIRGSDKAGNSSVQSYSWMIASAATPTPTPVITPAPTMTPAPADVSALVPLIAGGYKSTDSAYQRLYGPGIAFCDSIGNYIVGNRYSGVAFGASHRFRAPRGGNVGQLRLYWIDGSGYSAGTGGKVQIRILPDDGTANHYPVMNGTVYAEGNHVPGLVNGAFNRSVSFINTPVTMTSFQPLVAGQLYHVVYTQIDPNPEANYISVNNFVSKTENGPPTRWLSGVDWGALYGSRSSTSSTWTWDDRTLKPSSLYYAPILQIMLTDNSVFGHAVIETGNIDIRVYETSSSMPIREVFKPSQSMSFSGLSFMTSASAAGSLKWEILQGTTVLASGQVTESTANAKFVSGVAIHKWYDITLPTVVNFTAGQTYYVQFTPQGSSKWIWGLSRNGGDYSYVYPASFKESQAQHLYSGAWKNSSNYGPADSGGSSNWRVVLHKK